MFNSRVIHKLLDLSVVLAVFFTPLLFFIQSRDQFELPKLTFLALLALPLLLQQLREKQGLKTTPLSLALGLFLLTQAFASLPATSLSWKTSLWGDYENFAGLSTLLTYLLWFILLSRSLNEARVEKLLYFNSLAALLSSWYAIAQHFQFDFIQWNPESVNVMREFASMGNPNFLSAYLALSIPLFWTSTLKPKSPTREGETKLPWFSWILGGLGLAFLLFGTPKATASLFLTPASPLLFISRTLGLALFSTFCLRTGLSRSWTVPFAGSVLLLLGLLSTGSRGGFLGAAFGMILWAALTFRDREFSATFFQKFTSVPRSVVGITGALTLGLLFILGHSFLQRLATSILHLGQSLETSRLHIWRPALRIIRENPLHGIGLDCFKIAFPYYSGIEFNQIDGMFMSSRMAHNELLQTASTTGLLGLAAHLGVLGSFIWMGRTIYRSASPSLRWLLAGFFASALAYQVQNLFSFGVAGINFLWFFFLAAVQYFWKKSDPLNQSNRSNVLVVKGVLGLLAAAIMIFPLSRLGADIAYGRGSTISEMLKKPAPQMDPRELLAYSDYGIAENKKATDLFPMEVKYRLYLGMAYEQRAKLDPDHSKDWRLSALDCYQKVIGMSPANAYYYNDVGRVFTDLGSSDPQYLPKAVGALSDAVKWAPTSPYFIINYAMALRRTGEEAKAREQIQKSFQLDPSFTSKVLSQIAFEAYRNGDKKKAFEDLEEAIRGNSTSAESYYCRGILYLSEKEKKKALVDFEAVKKLKPTPDKNPSIQNLDQFTDQAKN